MEKIKSKYKYVYHNPEIRSKRKKWQAVVNKQRQWFDIEIEAAKWVDIQLIRLGKDPVNIFKKKQPLIK
jgi:hypothetical protein